MKKFSTLLVLLAALVGLQANAAIYMVGGAKTIGKWDPTAGLELTELEEGAGIFMAEDVNIYNGGNDFYFIFTDVIGGWDDVNGSLGEDGEVVNPSHRFSPLEANEQVAIVGTESEHIKTQYSFNGDASYYAPDGVYTIFFDANENEFQLTRTGDAVDDSDPIPAGDATIVYLKSADPETAHIYAWGFNSEGDVFGSWPGTVLSELETVEVDGETYYVAKTYAPTIGIVLNNGNGGTGNQTANIENVSGKIALEYPIDGDFTQYEEIAVPDVPAADLYVFGEINDLGWDPTKGLPMTTTDGNVYVAVNVNVQGYFSFTKKLADGTEDNMWDAIAPYRFAAADPANRDLGADAIGVPQPLTEDGVGYDDAFSLPKGVYTLTVDLAARTLVVSGEVVEDPYEPTGEVYILGTVNGNGWDPAVGVKMNTADKKIFTADVEFTGGNVDEESGLSYSYFSFTELLAAESGDWNAISQYRFGALENDYEVVLDSEMALADRKGTNSFKIEDGSYSLKLDFEGRTLVISKAGDAKKGDVNNDGVVNATDLGIIVNIIAGLDDKDNYDGRADLNADGTVNATDLGEVVNIIAGIAE